MISNQLINLKEIGLLLEKSSELKTSIHLKILTVDAKKECNAKIDNPKEIYDQFWEMSYDKRKQFLHARVSRLMKTRTTVTGMENEDYRSKRFSTFVYSFINPRNEEIIKVCKSMFLNTLGYSIRNDSINTPLMKSTAPDAIAARSDQRGKHPCKNKIDVRPIHNHIMSYHPQVSHYRRAHAPNRKYLQSDITITKMHQDFRTKNPDLSCRYDIYRREVSRLKISFTKLGEEQCEHCIEHIQRGHHHQEDDCLECIQWKEHVVRAQKSRKCYREDAKKDWGDEYSVRSADLQKVIMLPRMPGVKTAVFTKRIVGFHETFASIGVNESKTKKTKNMPVLDPIDYQEPNTYADTLRMNMKKNRSGHENNCDELIPETPVKKKKRSRDEPDCAINSHDASTPVPETPVKKKKRSRDEPDCAINSHDASTPVPETPVKKKKRSRDEPVLCN